MKTYRHEMYAYEKIPLAWAEEYPIGNMYKCISHIVLVVGLSDLKTAVSPW